MIKVYSCVRQNEYQRRIVYLLLQVGFKEGLTAYIFQRGTSATYLYFTIFFACLVQLFLKNPISESEQRHTIQ